MRRKDEQKANGNGRVKAFVFGFELEGSDDVLAEGIKAFTTAMSRNGMILAPASPMKPGLSAPKDNTASRTLEIEDSEEESELDAEHAQEEPYAANPGSKTSGNGSKRQYSYRAPKFLDELDLTTATKTLVEFMAEKGSPQETNDRYIAIAVWLKEQMKIEEFTIDHIYTAFHNLGWQAQMPPDNTGPLRTLKTKRHLLTQDKGAGYKVNWQGTQYVAKMGAGN